MFIDPPNPKPRPMPIKTSVELAAGNSLISWIVKKVKALKQELSK